MLKSVVKRALRPLRLLGRRFLLLPPIETQEFVGRYSCLHTAVTLVTRNQIVGDYMEFGVWKGDSFVTAYHSVLKNRHVHSSNMEETSTHLSRYGKATPEYEQWKQWRPRFFAFDSFEGLPEVSSEPHEDWARGAFYCSKEQFRATLIRDGVDLRDIVIVPGFYDRTLNRETKERYGMRKVAVAMIDCDLYESTVPVLDFLTDLVGQGTILIFDDWFRYAGSPKCGEQRACREWLERNPHFELLEYWREAPQSASLIVNLK